jgi:hypothetical protein
VWYTRDELARDSEVLLLRWGVLYKSGVYAGKALCLTPGELPVVWGIQTEVGVIPPDRRAEVSRGHSKGATP